MIDFGKWAFANRKLVYFLLFALCAGGAVSYYSMSKLEDPEIKVKQAVVATTYPGASAHQVELEVTDVLEKSIREIEAVSDVTSESRNDVSIITVELKKTVKDSEVEQVWDQLRRKVAKAQLSLPEGAGTPSVRDDVGNVFGIFYALTGDGLDNRELADYAELIKREIQTIDGIARVDISGQQSSCINVMLKQERMSSLGVLPMEVLSTLNGQNKTIYSGYYDSQDQRIRVTVDDKYRNVDDIKNLIIQGHEDDQLRLSDLADVEEDIVRPVSSLMTYDGQEALGIFISASSGTDITKIGKIVSRKMEKIAETRLPAGVEYHTVFYQPDRVNDALSSFIVNLIESVIIVILILMLAMGIRSGMIIGVSLVTIVLGSFLVLNYFGGTLQRVSLASFILAMGMLVDNAIVIVDGILVAMRDKTKSRMEVMTSIGKKTAMPLLGATVIAILAFYPIFLSPDTAGVYVRDLFIVLAVSLLLSWILALVHVPLMADRYLPKNDKEDSADPYSSKVYRALAGLLSWCFGHRLVTILAAVGMFALSVFCYQFLPQAFFPDMEYDQLYMEFKMDEGVSSTIVNRNLEEIESYLRKRPEIRHLTRFVGGSPSRYNLVRSVALPTMSYGELIIDFDSPKSLNRNIDEIQKYLTENYPEAYVKLKKYNLMYKKYPIEAVFMGPDPEVLHSLSRQAEDIMEKSSEVDLVTTDWEPKTPRLRVEYDQPSARALGLSRSEVGMSLLAAAGGIPVGSYYDGIHKKTIYIKTMQDDGKPVENLQDASVFTMAPSLGALTDKDLLVKLRSGQLTRQEIIESVLKVYPLSQACKKVTVDWEDPVVPRFNGERSQRVVCSPAAGRETEKARKSIEKQIESIHLPEGYTLRWEGEKRASDESMKYLFLNFPLAIILMVAIMIMLFGSYKKIIVIFCCIPLILVGVILAMLISGKPFGFVAICGVLGLVGMMIKNGIVLMDEITLQLQLQDDPIKALTLSSLSRLRPVMMASLTTVLGMIPLLSDSMFGPLAATIMGGLTFGTIIILILIPVLYAVFFNLGRKK